jgi:hypothetical protein
MKKEKCDDLKCPADEIEMKVEGPTRIRENDGFGDGVREGGGREKARERERERIILSSTCV